MRLFVAFTPPPEALAELEAAVAPLRQSWPELRWAGQDKWHVTLAFLGEVEAARRHELEIRLERAAGRHPPRVVRIGPGGAFPSAGRARVLWAQITGEQSALDGLSALAASVAAGARRAGAPPPDEDRGYRPHLTLARVRRPADLRVLVGELRGFHGSEWTASGIELIQSQQGSALRYETLARWSLGAGRDRRA